MKKPIAGAIALAMFLGLAQAGSGLAAGSADDMINTRQAEMKANTKAMKLLVSILKGETAYDDATVQSAVKSIRDAKAASDAADAWNASSREGATVKTEAKPEVWSDPEGFKAAWANLDKALTGLESAHDEAAFKAAFPALGASCKGCHEKFRASE